MTTQSTPRPEATCHILITNELARATAKIAEAHPDCAIKIEWFKGHDARTWFITAISDLVEHFVYMADDESDDQPVRVEGP